MDKLQRKAALRYLHCWCKFSHKFYLIFKQIEFQRLTALLFPSRFWRVLRRARANRWTKILHYLKTRNLTDYPASQVYMRMSHLKFKDQLEKLPYSDWVNRSALINFMFMQGTPFDEEFMLYFLSEQRSTSLLVLLFIKEIYGGPFTAQILFWYQYWRDLCCCTEKKSHDTLSELQMWESVEPLLVLSLTHS